MIKRLIFDIDNTLIQWKSEYDKAIDETLEQIRYPKIENLYKQIDKAEVEYEKTAKYFDKNEMLNFINNKLNINLPQEFMDVWFKKLTQCVPEKLDCEIYETLEELYNKYELVALTNWFESVQTERMKNVNIYKYFNKIYGAEKYAKPYKESFLQAIGQYKLEECAMIGDSIETDIQGAKNAGIDMAVWLSNDNDCTKKVEDIYAINKFEQLKDIF